MSGSGDVGGDVDGVPKKMHKILILTGVTLAIAVAIAVLLLKTYHRPVLKSGERPAPLSSSADFMSQFPPGVILAWYDKSTIPDGWAICDGQNGTPNLRKRFLRGAESRDVIGTAAGEGGSATHYHEVPVELRQGKHKGSDYNWGDTPWKNGPNPVSGGTSTTAKSTAVPNLPPFIDVLYIMKVRQ